MKVVFRHCSSCSNNFDSKIQKNVIDSNKRIHWYQCTFKHGFSKKEKFDGSVKECVTVLRKKAESFLSHIFIKRQQSMYFENLKLNLNDETICIQVDFSESFRIDVRDAIQSSYYSKDFASLFICYVWHLNGDHSCVYASDNLSHDKYYVSTALDHLFDKLKNQVQRLKYFHVFSYGAIPELLMGWAGPIKVGPWFVKLQPSPPMVFTKKWPSP